MAAARDLRNTLSEPIPRPALFLGTVREVDGLQGAENLAGLILLALAIIPGIAYYFDRTRIPWCTTCRRRVKPT